LERIASLQAESPINARSNNELGLLVSLWCGRDILEVPAHDAKQSYSFGFTAGEVQIDIKNGNISTTNRYKQEFYREKVDRSLVKKKGRKAKGGLSWSFGLSHFLPRSKISTEISAANEANELQTNKNEYWQVFWRVADHGIRTWRVYGAGLNEDNVLENRILGDEILCFVVPDETASMVEITVSFRCDIRDLWFHPERPANRAKIFQKSVPIERNKEAVASVLLSKSLNRRSVGGESGADERFVTLCKQRLVLKKQRVANDAVE
jgi:hypothetical protein